MADALFELTSGSDAWGADQAFGLSARAVFINNRGAYPVRLRWNASTGSAVARVPSGSSRLFTFSRAAVKTDIALYGVGGASAVDVEASSDPTETTMGGASGNLVLADLATTTPAALGSAAVGTGTTAARSDHVHAHPGGATVAAALAAAASAGVSTEVSRVDHVHPLPLGATVAAALAAAASAGVSTEASRVDHVHPLPLGATVALAPDDAASAGASTEASRVDHVHPLQPAGTITPSLAAEAGNERRLTLTCTTAGGAVATGVVELRLYSNTGAHNAIDQNLELITGTSAAWAVAADGAGANDFFMLVTPNGSGVIVVDIVDETAALSGNLYVTAFQPSTGGYVVVAAAFT